MKVHIVSLHSFRLEAETDADRAIIKGWTDPGPALDIRIIGYGGNNTEKRSSVHFGISRTTKSTKKKTTRRTK